MAPAAQRGAVLLEALIAAAVFAFGVLGNVALCAQALRHVASAQCRGDAVLLAHALIGRMRAEDPGTLAARYDPRASGDGYAAFARLASRLPGADQPDNVPEVRVEPGPTPSSRKVTVAVRWQLPGEAIAHRYATTAVVGAN